MTTATLRQVFYEYLVRWPANAKALYYHGLSPHMRVRLSLFFLSSFFVPHLLLYLSSRTHHTRRTTTTTSYCKLVGCVSERCMCVVDFTCCRRLKLARIVLFVTSHSPFFVCTGYYCRGAQRLGSRVGIVCLSLSVCVSCELGRVLYHRNAVLCAVMRSCVRSWVSHIFLVLRRITDYFVSPARSLTAHGVRASLGLRVMTGY
jgi:hypothetical protein